jgi:hypothetical protein
MYLDRLKKYNPKLNNVVTFTEKLALAQAAQADALAVRHGAGRSQEVQQPRQQMPAGDRGAMRRHLTGPDPIAHVERVLQHRLGGARPSRPRMRLGDLGAPPDQMRQTGLMRR